jgi:hypothetical protein
MKGFLRYALPTLCVSLALAAPAHAGTFGDSATSCEGRTAEQPFLRWLDPMHYVLAPDGGLEAGGAGWKLTGGARVESGNETFYVGGRTDKRSLYLPSGSTATTRPMCVSLLHPTFRYFAKNRGSFLLSSLLVEALVENPLTGKVLVLPAGVHTGGSSWHPSLPGVVFADLVSLLDSNGELAVAFRFRPVGLGAKWQIDDVYVDPFRNR